MTAGADRRGTRLGLNLVSVLHALAVGLVTVGLIVWSQPDATDPIVRAMSPTLADLAITSRAAGLGAVVVVVGAALAALLWRRQWQQGFELVLLTLVFATCPPLAAFGIYFGLWHAVRFTGRLVDAVRLHDCVVSHKDHGGAAAVRHLTKLSVAPTAVALVAVGVVISLTGVVTIQAQVAVLLAVTFPMPPSSRGSMRGAPRVSSRSPVRRADGSEAAQDHRRDQGRPRWPARSQVSQCCADRPRCR